MNTYHNLEEMPPIYRQKWSVRIPTSFAIPKLRSIDGLQSLKEELPFGAVDSKCVVKFIEEP